MGCSGPINRFDCNALFGFWPKRKIESSLQSLKTRMERHRIDKALICSTRGIFYDFVAGNEETLEVSKHDQRLEPVATINPTRLLESVDEVEKRLKQGFKVFRFFPTYQEWDLNYAPFYRILDALQDTKALVMLPSELGITPIARITENKGISAVVKNPRFADLAECIVLMQNTEHLYIESHRLNSCDGFEIFSNMGVINRVLFGTATPLCYIYSATWPIKKARITNREKREIFSRNLLRLLEKVRR